MGVAGRLSRTVSPFRATYGCERWTLKRAGHPGASDLLVKAVVKSRDITLLTKVCLVKAMVFPVVMYGCESWSVKKAES